MGGFNPQIYIAEKFSGLVDSLKREPMRRIQEQTAQLSLDQMLNDAQTQKEIQEAIANAAPGEENKELLKVLRRRKPDQYIRAINDIWDAYSTQTKTNPAGASEFLRKNTGIEISPGPDKSGLHAVFTDEEGNVLPPSGEPSAPGIADESGIAPDVARPKKLLGYIHPDKPETLIKPGAEKKEASVLERLTEELTSPGITPERKTQITSGLEALTKATTKAGSVAGDKEISTYTRAKDGKQVTLMLKAGMSGHEPGSTYEVESSGAVREPPRDPLISLNRAADLANKANQPENQLRDDYFREVKPLKERLEGYRQVRDASKLSSGAGDILMTYGFIRMVDPNRVTEGELRLAQQAGRTVPVAWRNWLEQHFGEGKFFGPDGTVQRKQMLEAANQFTQSYRNQYKSTEGLYRRIAKEKGLSEDSVVNPPFSSLGIEDPAPTRKFTATLNGVVRKGLNQSQVNRQREIAKEQGWTIQVIPEGGK